jgi:hypothetical protein
MQTGEDRIETSKLAFSTLARSKRIFQPLEALRPSQGTRAFTFR